MNTDNYRNFVEIADSGTLSAASEKLLIAQPALTKQVKRFEREYGTALFIRHARQMELTGAGRILYSKAKSIIALEDAAFKEIDKLSSGVAGTLSVAITPAHPDSFYDRLFTSFRDKYKDIEFDIREDMTPAILRMLKDNIVEAAIIRTPGRLPGNIVSVFSLPEKLVAIAAKSRSFFSPSATYVSIEDLKDVPLSVTRGFLPLIEAECERHGFEPHIINISTSRYMALLWAERGDAVALIPASDAEQHETVTMASRFLKEEEFGSERAVVFDNSRELSAAASTFIGYCRETFGTEAEE